MTKVAFKQCDVERVLRALKAVGETDKTVEITREGAIRILTPADNDSEGPLSPLEEWERAHGVGGA